MRIPTVGMSLGLFFAITFVICVLWGLAVPSELEMHPAWAPLFPWFEWLSWPSFFLGLVEAFAYGWYGALVYVPLYNYFSRREEKVAA